ncbi:MAG: prepilin-type N-terminal cleavage/methylation domain-containing protein [Terrimicrobiaceae bacterium]|nr:prepilin-type N-terminal cleavage/methylation domain-containing protein [Terrimicrobiaceae bacterium]
MKRARGFTLFEVLISIAIFMLLAGGIFAAVRAAFTASAEIATAQLDSERGNAFQQFLRKFFQSLPADAKIELRLRKQAGRGDVVELLAWPMPPFLRFGTNSGDGMAISAMPDGRGNFRIALGYFRADDPPDTRDRRLEETQWLPLLPNVSTVHWRFAPERNPVFSDTWNAGNARPGIAELTLRMTNGSESTFAYWIPPLQRRSTGAPDDGNTAPQPPGGEPAAGPPPTSEENPPPPAMR